MKRFLPYILILTIIVQIFAPFSVDYKTKNNIAVQNNKAEAAEECVLKEENISFPNGYDNNYPDDPTIPRPENLTMSVKTTGCINRNIYIKITSVKDGGVDTLELETDKYLIKTNDFSFTFKTGEKTCDETACDNVWFKLIIERKGNETFAPTLNVGSLSYLCLGKNALGQTECNAGNGDYNWKVISSSLSPINESLDYTGKYYYKTIYTYQYSEAETTEVSKPFDTIELCNIDRANTNSQPPITGVYIKTTPCELFNASTQTTTEYYFYEITNKTTGEKNTSDKFYGSNTTTAIDACNKSRTDFINLNVAEVTVSECIKGTSTQMVDGTKKVVDDNSGFPACSFMSPSTYGGCIGIVLYWLLFKTTSFIFGLTGKVLDFTLMYSISDGAYRSGFVVQGWGIVRDFCNMFFIFVLLYIAFGTILGLHSVKTKEMIINVIIIGLLINFSLFATQVIIDASNILTRVFYNQNTIITGVKDPTTGVINNQLGEFGEIKLSEAIVSKVDPQKLVIEAKKVSGIPQDGVANEDIPTGISAGSFIIVVILATIINIVGMIAFLSAGLIFIARVIGLWLAMIVSPLVFFSYTVPALQDMEMIGWKKWWPETLKLAFLAPVFAFFMYLVVGFMDKGMGVIDASHQDGVGLGFLVAIIVPFIFIMILIMKAKDIAKDMSGKMGQSITNGIAAAGGIVLGGAALGAAGLGRRVIGQTMAKASRGETATQKYEAAKGNPVAMAKLTAWEKTKGAVGSYGTLGILGKAYGKIDPSTGKVSEKSIGGLLNKKQKEVGEVDHARHEMDEAKKAAGLEGVDDSKLSGEDINKIKANFNKLKKSEFESEIRKGSDNKGNVSLKDASGTDILDNRGNKIYGESDFKQKKRSEVETEYKNENNLNPSHRLTKKEEKDVEDKLNVQFNVALKAAIEHRSNDKFKHEKEKASEHVNPLTRTFAGANKGSYDIRKLSDIKSDKRESALFSKVPIALIAGIATGVRTGMKNVGVSNGGIKVEGNFMKDLGNTISDSLKSMRVSVDLSHAGEHKSSADSHGGGHGGGHH